MAALRPVLVVIGVGLHEKSSQPSPQPSPRWLPTLPSASHRSEPPVGLPCLLFDRGRHSWSYHQSESLPTPAPAPRCRCMTARRAWGPGPWHWHCSAWWTTVQSGFLGVEFSSTPIFLCENAFLSPPDPVYSLLQGARSTTACPKKNHF